MPNESESGDLLEYQCLLVADTTDKSQSTTITRKFRTGSSSRVSVDKGGSLLRGYICREDGIDALVYVSGNVSTTLFTSSNTHSPTLTIFPSAVPVADIFRVDKRVIAFPDKLFRSYLLVAVVLRAPAQREGPTD